MSDLEIQRQEERDNAELASMKDQLVALQK